MSETPPRPTVDYPPAPVADEVLAPFELIGPDILPPGIGAKKLDQCYRIIDRRTARRDINEEADADVVVVKTEAVVLMLGDDSEMFDALAQTMFAEFKRRVLYQADVEWRAACKRMTPTPLS